MKKTLLLALLLSGAMGLARADVLLQEGFEDVDALRSQNWIFSNESIPPGPVVEGWFQGNPDEVFPAHMGPPNSYVASNYNAAGPGGILNNWLLTPTFSLEKTVTVSFWMRGQFFPNTSDQVRFGFTDSDGVLDDFLQATVVTAPVDDWTRFTMTLDGQGAGATGRFGFQHFGLTDFSNFVGIDTLQINDVPEPSTVMILGLGLAGFALARRRRA